MNSRRRWAPRLETMEERVALSAALAAPVMSVHAETSRPFLLNGTLRGSNPQAGLKVNVSASGAVRSMGKVQATGVVYLYAHRGGSFGTIDLSNNKGTVHLMVLSGNPVQFQIVSGTGAYASASGTGTLVLRPGTLKLHSNRH